MRALLLALVLGACAVKGYDLGWRSDDRISGLLGGPLDALDGCRYRPQDPPPRPPCLALVGDVNALLRDLPSVAEAPVALGAQCTQLRCRYSNSYQRRDVGLAAVVPIYRKISLRTVRMRFEPGDSGKWSVAELIVMDNAPPSYGPVRVGG